MSLRSVDISGSGAPVTSLDTSPKVSRKFTKMQISAPLPATGAEWPSRGLARSAPINPDIALAIDSVAILCAALASTIGYHWIALGSTGDIVTSVGIGLLIAAVYCTVFRSTESRRPQDMQYPIRSLRTAASAWTISFLLFLMVAFVLKAGADLSRGATLSLFFVGLFAIVLSRMRLSLLATRLAPIATTARREIILIGTRNDRKFQAFVQEICATVCPQARTVTLDACCAQNEWPAERERFVDQAYLTARSAGRGEIFVSISGMPGDRAASILRALSRLPRAVFVIPDSDTADLLRRPVTPVGSNVAVQMQAEPLNTAQRFVKRSIDAVGALALILLTLPLLGAIALAIKCSSPGPVLFRQRRLGYRGRPFTILKFRTMRVQEDGPVVVQARKDDERVTAVGRWLRRTSFDELPQLLNVLRGDMSLIGPRPHALAHDEFYARLIENYEIRQHVKPGLTGWAQVNGYRGETAAEEFMIRRIEHDLWYVTNCNLLLDLQILVRTVFAVLRQRNAY